MLNNDQIERLITIEQWLEEIQDSPEFEDLDFYPDLTVGDARQAVAELLDAQKPSNFTTLEDKPVMRLYRVRPWHEKLKDHIFVALGEVAVTSLIVAAVSGCASLFCWGVSDIKGGMGYTSPNPDFAAQSQMHKGLAIASVGISLGCSVVAGCVIGGKKDV
jgi:hypothetical protein